LRNYATEELIVRGFAQPQVTVGRSAELRSDLIGNKFRQDLLGNVVVLHEEQGKPSWSGDGMAHGLPNDQRDHANHA